MEISERLKQARTSVGETQEQFARRFPVSQPVYCRWEAGDRPPNGPSRALIERVMAELEPFMQEPVK